MLKKKNMAIMMAVATVATTVAPAFAATVETQIVTDEAKLISDVQKMLETRYTNAREDGRGGVAKEAYQNSVYEITYTKTENNVNKEVVIENVSQLKQLIEANKVNNATLNLTVTDKGHKVVDGVTYATEKNEYVKYATTNELDKIADEINSVIGTATKTTATTSSATITLANTSVDPIVVTTDDYKLDLSKPVDKNGNLVSSTTADANIAKKVVGFKTLETGKVIENDMPSKVTAKYDFRNEGFTKTEENVSKYVSGGIYTEEGAELVNMLVKANAAADHTTRIVKNGNAYTVACNTTTNPDQSTNDLSVVEAVKDGGYKLTLNTKVTQESARAITAGSNTQLIIKSDSQKELADLRAAMVKSNVNTDLVEAGKGVYTTLAGDDRFETAIAISKESYKNHDDKTSGANKANAVVLVGEDAIVDGLASAPLAKQKKAPVLLTKKDAVGEKTLTEMKRIIAKDSTVYLVGGEAVISKSVEAQLVKEMNVKIVRLAGDDRFETSLEIANAMTGVASTSITDAFVVGGDGEADAMSIASVASMKTGKDASNVEKVAPIIVAPANGLTKDAKHFFEKNENKIANIGVIGGEDKVSTQVLKDLKEIDKATAPVQTIERFAGDDRHQTNVAVIEHYFTGSNNKAVYVAKDGYVGGNGKLIDALAVASLAGENNAPIVLATEDLTKEQVIAVEKITTPDASATKTNHLTKVGNGISSTVMSKLVKLLGL